MCAVDDLFTCTLQGYRVLRYSAHVNEFNDVSRVRLDSGAVLAGVNRHWLVGPECQCARASEGGYI